MKGSLCNPSGVNDLQFDLQEEFPGNEQNQLGFLTGTNLNKPGFYAIEVDDKIVSALDHGHKQRDVQPF